MLKTSDKCTYMWPHNMQYCFDSYAVNGNSSNGAIYDRLSFTYTYGPTSVACQRSLFIFIMIALRMFVFIALVYLYLCDSCLLLPPEFAQSAHNWYYNAMRAQRAHRYFVNVLMPFIEILCARLTCWLHSSHAACHMQQLKNNRQGNNRK